MFKFILALTFLLPAYSLASDAQKDIDFSNLKVASSTSDSIGEMERPRPPDSEYQAPTDENGRPRITCRNKNTMLDQTGCLQADGKLAKHCAVIENFRPLAVDIADPCGQGWKKSYLCHDYAICLKDEGASTKTKKKTSDKYETTR